MTPKRLLLMSLFTLLVSLTPSLAQRALGSFAYLEPVAQGSDSWRSFQSREGRFEVLFPQQPERMQQRVELPGQSTTQYAFASEDGLAEYLISYTDYPQEFISRIGEPSDFLQAVKEGFLGGIGARDVVTQSRRLQGYPGLSVEYVAPNGLSGYAHFYLVNDRLYQIIVTPQSGNAGNWSENAQRFLTSFSLR
ncbi:MAG: hypothetical protein JJU32_18635 [Phormidium sp. BM_Day4_Bin.17]|nr:hypothetical protein [Phormidium sp. BM_Day4_Bin.17]UCJ11992.1 MAG: hypothetical protein JWS08_20135 [Phormidium sp. PBR-2020]